MCNPFFSVIIPAYNTVQCIPQCMDSLLAQSCGDFEVILVDDASADGTGELVEQFASGDARIHAIHIPHAGASAARNTGLRAAVGEYVLFLDSDDMLVSDALERIRAKLDGRPDMLWFGFLHQGADGTVREGQKLNDICYASASEAVVDWIQKNIMPISAANKVFRLSVVRDYGIAFRENFSFGEDRLFNLDYLRHCEQVVTSSDNLYVYVIRSGSASHCLVPDLLSTLLMIHQERLSVLLPLCKQGMMTEEKWGAFSAMDYVNSVESAWLHLAEHYTALTQEGRERELRQYLGLHVPEGMPWKGSGRSKFVCLWFTVLKLANRIHSLLLLKLMMSATGLMVRR